LYPKAEKILLIVNLLVETTLFTKAFMDGGSGLNLTYHNTFEGLGLGQDLLKNSLHPFYRVVLSMQFIPLGQINLSATFRDASNYRTKTLTFDVVDFSGPYHIILEPPCYIKFMAIPSCAYLKLVTSHP
jgi:hypothetical protein